MKKLLLILLCLPLLFTTCKKEEDNSPTNNTGNNANTFLSINDGTVWVCQDCERGNVTTTASGKGHGDSLIGFYNATNFLYERWRVNDTLPCLYYYEGSQIFTNPGTTSDIQIITNTPNEFTFTEVITGGGMTVTFTRRFTGSGNQINNELILTDQNGQSQNMSPWYATTYIKSTALQNLSCN